MLLGALGAWEGTAPGLAAGEAVGMAVGVSFGSGPVPLEVGATTALGALSLANGWALPGVPLASAWAPVSDVVPV
jgi:hypothetical protein